MARRQPSPFPADHELFAGLDRKQLARAGDLFEVIDLPAGQSVGEQGRAVSGFVTILEGQIGVTIDDRPLAVLDDGSHLGALSLLDDERPTHRASFNVLAPSRVAVVTAERFPEMLQELPTVAERICAIVDVRRAYLAGLAAAADKPQATPSTFVSRYPVHVRDLAPAPARRPVMQVRGRTSR